MENTSGYILQLRNYERTYEPNLNCIETSKVRKNVRVPLLEKPGNHLNVGGY